jgi:hypothetical protein
VAADKAKTGKSGVTLAIILIVVYAIVFVGTLKYTGVIGGSNNENTNAAGKNVDNKNDEKPAAGAGDVAKQTGDTSTTSTTKKSDSTTSSSTTSSTSSTTSSTTLASTSSTSNPAQQNGAGNKFKKLVKVYENMDSEQAANIMAKLSNSEATALLSAMSAEQAAEILGAMSTSRAAILSEKLGLQQE